ncbi:MAG TPA: hypothetical protein VMC06_08140 [Opitutaceae bacterium]|nr:hypothetical protein [Opitutaceae bacterium]
MMPHPLTHGQPLAHRPPFGFGPFLAGALILALVGSMPSALGAPKRSHQGPPVVTGSGIAIVPSDTDPQIKSFDSPHFVYIERDIVVAHQPNLPPDRHELLLWLTGTNGQGQGPVAFCELAARLGYRVVVLMYPDDIAATACKGDRDPGAFEAFRLAIIEDGATKHITVSRTDSIENRLVKLLQYLKVNRADEHWEQFLDPEGGIKWSTVAVAGQSQGGGHAALIGIKHRVVRVICTGAPKDYSAALNRPAAWYGETSATPKRCFFSFNHQQDGKNGCTFEQQMKNVQALQLDEFGPPVDVDQEPYPYRGARILTTNCPAQNPHTAVIATPNAARFQKVWLYMLTAEKP